MNTLTSDNLEDRLDALVIASAKASRPFTTVVALDAVAINLKAKYGNSPEPVVSLNIAKVESARKCIARTLDLHLGYAWGDYYRSLPFYKKHKARLNKDQWIKDLQETLTADAYAEVTAVAEAFL